MISRFLIRAMLLCLFTSVLNAQSVQSVQQSMDKPQIPPSMFLEYSEPGVIVLALGSIDPEEEKSRQMLKELLGEDISDSPLIDLQMDIARAASRVSRVLLLVSDAQTHTLVTENCQMYDVCDQIAAGRIRTAIVSHEGAWIRDYGPQIGTSDGKPVVLDAQYRDPREERGRLDSLAKINRARLGILMTEDGPAERLLTADALDPFDETMRGRSSTLDEDLIQHFAPDQSSGSTRAQALDRLREMADIFRDGDPFQRTLDDEAPFAVAEAALKDYGAALYRPPLALDGGDFLLFAGDECISSKELIAKNSGVEQNLRQQLHDFYGCKTHIYLNSLPGPVIQHVDMFLLPAGGKRVFLAWYDPTEEPLKSVWADLPSEQKALVLEAAVAMRKNELELQKHGYEVTRVPSPTPRFEDDEVYYPTILNALVHVGTDGQRQVLMPGYQDYQEAIQETALQILQDGFGPAVRIERLDATLAAQRQGAIHCLTSVIPAKLSVFEDKDDQEIRANLNSRIQQLEEELVAAKNYNFEGLWKAESEEIPFPMSLTVDLESLALSFEETSVQTWPYRIHEKRSSDWFFSFSDADSGREEKGRIIWTDADHALLVLGSDRITLTRQAVTLPEEEAVDSTGDRGSADLQ